MRKGTCINCGTADVWINLITYEGKAMGEVCGECFDEVKHDRPSRNRRNNTSSGRNHSDPGLENAVRALEDRTE